MPLIIRIALLLMLAALVLLVTAKISVALTVLSLSALITQAGLMLLLAAFALLLVIGVLDFLKRFVKQCVGYFSPQQRQQRKFLFMQCKKAQVEQLLYFKSIQIDYFNEVKRKHLLNANNCRHIKQLSKSIDNELSLLKQRLPATDFQQLQEENNRCRNRCDSAKLLELQQKLTKLR